MTLTAALDGWDTSAIRLDTISGIDDIPNDQLTAFDPVHP